MWRARSRRPPTPATIPSTCAHFAEVGVDTVTGEVRMRKMFEVFAAGRILNAKTAKSRSRAG